MEATSKANIKERRVMYITSIRRQDNNRIFNSTRLMNDDEDHIDATIPRISIKDEIDIAERDFSNQEVLTNPNKLEKSIEHLRELLTNVSEDDRDDLISALFDNGVWKVIFKLLEKFRKENNVRIVREITWIIQVILASSTDLVAKTIDLGIYSIYFNLIQTNDFEVLENVIWGYANLVVDNREVRDTFEDVGIMNLITDRILEINQSSFNKELLRVFYLFLDYYFNMKPFFDFERMQNHVDFSLKLLNNYTSDQLKSLMQELLGFLSVATLVAEKENLEMISDQGWDVFVSKMIELHQSDDLEIVKRSTEILTNLTFFNFDRNDILLQGSFMKSLTENLEKEICLEQTLQLCSNISCCAREFLDAMAKENLIIVILMKIKLITFMSEKLFILLNYLDKILFDCHSQFIFFQLSNNTSLIGEVIEKINMKLPDHTMLAIGRVLNDIFAMGERAVEDNLVMLNPFTDFVEKNPNLIKAIEYAQMYSSEDIYMAFQTLVETYFDQGI